MTSRKSLFVRAVMAGSFRGKPLRSIAGAGRTEGGKPMRALGMMSGTSMDGVDAAVLETDGETIAAFGPSAFVPYAPPERAILRAGLGKWPWDGGLEPVEALVRERHATAAAGFAGLEAIGF